MDISTIVNVVAMQRHRCYASSSMIVSTIANVATTQRCKRCTFDSPGLTSENEVYPGLFAVSGNNAVGVELFLCRHAYNETFHGGLRLESATLMALKHVFRNTIFVVLRSKNNKSSHEMP